MCKTVAVSLYTHTYVYNIYIMSKNHSPAPYCVSLLADVSSSRVPVVGCCRTDAWASCLAKITCFYLYLTTFASDSYLKYINDIPMPLCTNKMKKIYKLTPSSSHPTDYNLMFHRCFANGVPISFCLYNF